MDRAVQLFNNNCNVRNLQEIENILEALKQFIAINKSIENRSDTILPRIYSFIALCNYKMGNFDRAYWCAKKSIELGEEAMANSVLISDVNFYLDKNVFVLVETLEKNHSSEIDFSRNYHNGEENVFDDSIVQDLIQKLNPDKKPTKETIKTLIEVLSKIQDNASKFFESKGDGFQAFQYNQMVDTFKLPLYCAWQGYKYGWHTDFLEEGDSLFPYMMFEAKATEMLADLIKVLKDESPFALLERNGAITKELIKIYSTLKADIEAGNVKL